MHNRMVSDKSGTYISITSYKTLSKQPTCGIYFQLARLTMVWTMVYMNFLTTTSSGIQQIMDWMARNY